MKNKIKTLDNGDFEVRPVKGQMAYDYAGLCKTTPPVPGAIAVYRLGGGLEWEHKGWLMPTVMR